MLNLADTYSHAFKLHQAGRLVEAETFYRAIVADEPRHAGTHHLIGLVQHQLGRNDAALLSIKEAIALDDSEPNYHNNLGSVYRALDRRTEAAACYRHAIALKPDFAEAHANLGMVLQDEGQFSNAQREFETALALKPDYALALFNLGNVLAMRGEAEKAVDYYLKAIQSDPGFVDAYNNLGAALSELGQLDQAAECYRCVLAIQPNNVVAHNNLGNVLAQRDELAAASQSFAQAIRLQPHYVEAHINLGNEFLEDGKPAEAEAAYRRALALDPTNENAHRFRGLACLVQGGLAEGWREWRWNVAASQRFTQPEWRGEDLNGATILIHAEQGFGDTIHFARYLPMVADKGGRVIVEAPVELHRLIASMRGVDEVLAFGDKLPDFAWHCPLLSLPIAFNTELASIPATAPYLEADAETVSDWRRRLDHSGLKVGLVWAGRPEHKRDRHRSLSLSALAPLAPIDNVSFFALQKGAAVSQADHAPAGMRIEVLAPFFADFADTAAAIMALDLVITVDTSVAHLAGALGKPVWVLLPYAPDWRWLEQRSDSPWYPTARLFRQSVARRWEPVMVAVADALDELANGGKLQSVRQTTSA